MTLLARWLLRLASAVFLLSGGVAIAEPVDRTSLTLGLAAVAEFTPAYVALDRGYFAAHGLDVTLQIVTNSSTLVPALLSDSVQIGGPPPPVFLQAIGQGVPIGCFAAAALSDPQHPIGAVVAKPSSGIKTAADLSERRLAVSGLNSIMQILLRRWLSERQINPTRITFVEVPFSSMADAVKNGSVDAAVEVEPFVTRMHRDGIAETVLDYYRDVPSGTLSVAYCSARDWATAHPNAIAGFRAALAEAGDFIAKDPAAAREILAKTLKLPPAVASGLPFGFFRFTLEPSQISWWVQTLRDQKLLDAPIEPASVILQ